MGAAMASNRVHRPGWRWAVAFLALLAAAGVSNATLVRGTENAGAKRRPNVVLILADDFGYECVRANGGTSYQTPNLDRLAAEGVRFTRCHAQPLCTPTRVQLLTGAYNVRNYTRFAAIDPALTTIAHHFLRAGYATAAAGKWQLGRDPGLPSKLGFAETCLWQHTRRPPRYANPGLEYNGKPRNFKDGEYGPDLVNDFALDFIARRKDKPFFLYYPLILTHGPFQPTPDSQDWDPKLRGEQARDDHENFAEMVAYMDKLVGKLVTRLDELGIGKNTLVVFVGDNGTARAIRSQFAGQEYRGGKGTPKAAGTHVPLIVRWPAAAKSGTVCQDLIDTTDFLPTICAAAGIEVPKEPIVDGQSFLPQLRGEPRKPREWVYCWYSRNGGAKADHEFALGKQYKLYRDGSAFDVLADPRENAPLQADALDVGGRYELKKLEVVLRKYESARPERLRAKAGATP
jgi:arylsulfatase A